MIFLPHYMWAENNNNYLANSQRIFKYILQFRNLYSKSTPLWFWKPWKFRSDCDVKLL